MQSKTIEETAMTQRTCEVCNQSFNSDRELQEHASP